ncbi:MAG: hypothetical protein A2048_00005 [Deltaproteobacteria bacterium GWA2_45_12]|nr:MAG: hypothetical protein A2048_00005 [Deltaproteobacteria bacterium GWA2_45_12]
MLLAYTSRDKQYLADIDQKLLTQPFLLDWANQITSNYPNRFNPAESDRYEALFYRRTLPANILSDFDFLTRLFQGNKALAYLCTSNTQIKNNRELILQLLTDTEGWIYPDLPEMIKKDPDLILQLPAKTLGWIYSKLPDVLKKNPEIANKAINAHFQNIYSLPPNLQDRPEIVDKAIQTRKWRYVLEHGLNRVQDDEKTFIKIVRDVPGSLKKASARLKRDPILAAVAVSKHLPSIRDVDPQLVNDPVWLRSLLEKEPYLFRELDKVTMTKFLADSNLMAKILVQAPLLLKQIPDDMKNALSDDTVLGIVTKWGNGLGDLPQKFWDNESIVLQAYKSYDTEDEPKLDFLKISDRLRKDPNFIRRLVQTRGLVYKDLSENARKDVDLAFTAVSSGEIGQKDNFRGKLIPDSVLKNPKVLEEYLKHRSLPPEINLEEYDFVTEDYALQYLNYRALPNRLKENPNFVLKLLNKNKYNYAQLPEEMKMRPEIQAWATGFPKQIYKDYPESLKLAQKDLAILVLQHDRAKLEDIPESLRNDPDIISETLKTDPKYYSLLPANIKNNPQIIEQVLTYNHELFYLVPLSFHKDEDFIFRLVQKNVHIVQKLPFSLQKKILDRLAQLYRDRGIPPEHFQSYHALRQFMNTKTVDPLLFKSLDTFIKVYLTVKQGSKPVILFFQAKKDWDKAFYDYPIIDQLVQDGRYEVIYKEVESEDEIYAVMDDLITKGIKVRHGVISAHGSQDTIALSDDDPGQTFRLPSEKNQDSPRSIDFADFDQGEMDRFKKLFEEKGDLVLAACSNGKGETSRDNLANRFTTVLPHGVRVHSSPKSMNIRDFILKEDGSMDVVWTTLKSYVTNGKN